MVPARPGFIERLRELTRQAGTLLVLDETHTLSSGRGGWARQAGIEPDFVVVGKPIAGGLPAAAYGFGAEIAARMQAAKDAAPPGHSGIGTTLAGNRLTLAAIHATLTEVATADAYAHMLGLAATLESRLRDTLARHALPWCVSRLGARLELQFCATPPATAAAARAAQNDELEHAIHLYLLNRGVLLTPFHNMMLVSPATRAEDCERLLAAFDDCLGALGDAG
jgi:glutamate-1-semialdehyde 2,1-aminomutase